MQHLTTVRTMNNCLSLQIKVHSLAILGSLLWQTNFIYILFRLPIIWYAVINILNYNFFNYYLTAFLKILNILLIEILCKKFIIGEKNECFNWRTIFSQRLNPSVYHLLSLDIHKRTFKQWPDMQWVSINEPIFFEKLIKVWVRVMKP
jgi:hypothetical protein